MKLKAGSRQILSVLWVLFVPSLKAAHQRKEHNLLLSEHISCDIKQLVHISKKRITLSSKKYDELNGDHIPSWPPGFPDLCLPHGPIFNGSRVQCSLLFMVKALGLVLDDQQSNMNPDEVELHDTLKQAISSVDMLASCAKKVLGGDCSPGPSTPVMPHDIFERKQWGHTLLKESEHYLASLLRMVKLEKLKFKIKRGKKSLYYKARFGYPISSRNHL